MSLEGSLKMPDEPIVWSRYEVTKNGKTYKIRIQQVTPDLGDAVIDHMTTYFLAKEPTTSHSKLASDPVSLKEIQDLWRSSLDQGTAIVAILENGCGSTPHNIIGANMLAISTNEKKKAPEYKGKQYIKVIETVMAMFEEGNLLERYGVDKCLVAFGLSAHPDYSGLQLGQKLLEAREPICKHLGLKFTSTVFSAANAQYIANKIGYETVIEHEYKTYVVNGKIHFPDLEGKISLMVKFYE